MPSMTIVGVRKEYKARHNVVLGAMGLAIATTGPLGGLIAALGFGVNYYGEKGTTEAIKQTPLLDHASRFMDAGFGISHHTGVCLVLRQFDLQKK